MSIQKVVGGKTARTSRTKSRASASGASSKKIAKGSIVSRVLFWGFERTCFVLAPFVFAATLVVSLVGFAVVVKLST